jgi:hypothetical protein
MLRQIRRFALARQKHDFVWHRFPFRLDLTAYAAQPCHHPILPEEPQVSAASSLQYPSDELARRDGDNRGDLAPEFGVPILVLPAWPGIAVHPP